MNTIQSTINELKEALLNCKEMKRYQKACEELSRYPERERRVHELRRKNYLLQNSKEPINLFSETDRMAREFEDVYKDPVSAEFLSAEVAVCKIIQQINRELVECLDLMDIMDRN